MTPEGVFIRNPDKLFIGGQWVAPLSGESIEVVNPNSEEVIARVAAAGDADMDRAVEAAREAFDHGPWPTTPPAERGKVLMAMAAILERRVPEIAKAWMRPDRRPDHPLRRHADGLGDGHARDRRARRSLPVGREEEGPDGRYRGDRARARRRGRRHRPVERAVRDHAQQGRLRADRREHDRDEAEPGNPARSLHHRRSRRGSGSARRACSTSSRPIAGVGSPDPFAGHRQGQLHRVDRRPACISPACAAPSIDALPRSSSAASRRRSCATTSRSRTRPTSSATRSPCCRVRSARCSAGRSSPRTGTTSSPRRSPR